MRSILIGLAATTLLVFASNRAMAQVKGADAPKPDAPKAGAPPAPSPEKGDNPKFEPKADVDAKADAKVNSDGDEVRGKADAKVDADRRDASSRGDRDDRGNARDRDRDDRGDARRRDRDDSRGRGDVDRRPMTRDGHVGDGGRDSWRFKFHNNHWWYWLPEDRWVIWYDGKWVDYDANTYNDYYPQAQRRYSYRAPSEYRSGYRGDNYQTYQYRRGSRGGRTYNGRSDNGTRTGAGVQIDAGRGGAGVQVDAGRGGADVRLDAGRGSDRGGRDGTGVGVDIDAGRNR